MSFCSLNLDDFNIKINVRNGGSDVMEIQRTMEEGRATAADK